MQWTYECHVILTSCSFPVLKVLYLMNLELNSAGSPLLQEQEYQPPFCVATIPFCVSKVTDSRTVKSHLLRVRLPPSCLNSSPFFWT